jgi:hypothetical protein
VRRVPTYNVEATVGGKLAQIGSRLIQSTAKKLADEFFKNFVNLLNEEKKPIPDHSYASSEKPFKAPLWAWILLISGLSFYSLWFFANP